MSIYEKELAKYQSLFDRAAKRFNGYSIARLALGATMIVVGYLYLKNREMAYGFPFFIALVLFLLLLRLHAKVAQQKRFYQQLLDINRHEMAALQGNYSAFEAGDQYIDPQHAYSFDLDVFGKNSLFQSLNRTANSIGSQRLAACFLQPDKSEIYETQEALRELSPRLEWRQEFLALGQLHADKKEQHLMLFKWAKLPGSSTPMALQVLWYLLSVLSVVLAITSLAFGNAPAWKVFQVLAALNLMVVMAHSNKIKQELRQLNAIFKVVQQYGYLLQKIETAGFLAPKLKRIEGLLVVENTSSSEAVLKLSRLLDRLESVQNLFAALLANSLFLYHLHVLLGLEKWKKRYAVHVKSWIEAIGEMEALCSLAHFSFNNPDFIYPEITESVQLDMRDLGHPLIPAKQRVCNSLQFEKPGFVVLTGSNMSGKSTFLRTVGLNLLLAKTGAPVCASRCNTYPFEVFVCMKLSDSLHDNESYFYAELKRLQRIIQELESGPPGFALLDEVLRGTNSNDKLTGTLGLVETMVRVQATGILATHDLNVCELTYKHPEALRNMCFEVEIGADQLHFDYRLREGVCVNKSASFLMKKNGGNSGPGR
jgi:hypothetical protein